MKRFILYIGSLFSFIVSTANPLVFVYQETFSSTLSLNDLIEKSFVNKIKNEQGIVNMKIQYDNEEIKKIVYHSNRFGYRYNSTYTFLPINETLYEINYVNDFTEYNIFK